MFFLLQPVLILVEGPVKTALLPAWLRRSRAGYCLEVAVTLSIILVSAELLFWESLESCGIDQQGLQEVGLLILYLKGLAGL